MFAPATIAVFSLGFLMVSVEGVSFQLYPNTHKCLVDTAHAKTVIKGEFDVSEHPNQAVDFRVMDEEENLLYNRPEAKGHGNFAFTSDKDVKFELCFISRVPEGMTAYIHEVSIATKHGVEAKNYEVLEGAAKLKPLEMDLRKLEDLSEAIVQDFAYMREREEQMRDTNESTSTRVMYFTVFSLCCLMGLAAWQVLYLRTYFKAKKLIE